MDSSLGSVDAINETANTTTSTSTEPNQPDHNETTFSMKQNGECSFLGVSILYQLIQAANLFEKLDLNDVLSLALTSNQFFKQLSPMISNTYVFKYHSHTNIQHYHPKKLLIMTQNLKGLFNNPFLSNVYKIKFDNRWNLEFPELPDSVTHVTLSTNLGNYISKLPLKITHLELSYWFWQHIAQLPPTTKQVIVSEKFKQSVSHLSKDIQFKVRRWENNAWVFRPYEYQPSQ
eukprot:TRINITY_DN3938_c0_g1_i1.p1 TRINITY_DN3938_c0_g1~~TRINITY_DN3938_c0_g1_i1.p1  ORF type:complete len:232 (+),score=39.96 TRINITY_DN3938_c0_g1_i1:780-1475(+)